MNTKNLFGFHAVTTRLRTQPASVQEIFVDAERRDARMSRFLLACKTAGKIPVQSESSRLQALCGHHRHQGVVARVTALEQHGNLDELIEDAPTPLVLALDSITDPHNLGAILRSAEGAGVTAVIAPKDHSVGITDAVARVSCGASELVPYFTVTNLAREIKRLRDMGLWAMGLADEATHSIYQSDFKRPLLLVLGAEGEGLRRLVGESCDELVSIPMQGTLESLNVSVAAGICLFEVVRQRL